MSNPSKIISKLAERMEKSSHTTSTRHFVDTDLSPVEQTIGLRYHHFVVSTDHLGIDKIAHLTDSEPADILAAALTLCLLDDNRAWEMLSTRSNTPPSMDQIDKYADSLDSWYCQIKSALMRTFAFIKDYLNVSDVVMHDGNHALIEILEEYDLPQS